MEEGAMEAGAMASGAMEAGAMEAGAEAWSVEEATAAGLPCRPGRCGAAPPVFRLLYGLLYISFLSHLSDLRNDVYE
jgi:hypothetical protein